MLFLMVIDDVKVRTKLEQLYKHYHRDMYVRAYHVLKDHHDAEDVIQTVIIKMADKVDGFSELKSMKTRAYVLTAVQHQSIDLIRKRDRQVTTEQSFFEGQVDDRENPIEEFAYHEHNRELVAGKMKDIKREYADIIVLKFFQQLNNGEIAQILNIKENNVRVRLSRALKALELKILEH
jgi:RNA polymerase sigma-70 factor (ECF subfamily)